MERSLKEFLNTTEKPIFKKPEPHSLSQRQAIEEGMILPRVVIDSHSHPIYTLVEVEASDRQGLFYDLVQVFSQRGLSIDLARIATEMGGAFDTFYVLNSHGEKIEDADEKESLQRQLAVAIAPALFKKRGGSDNKVLHLSTSDLSLPHHGSRSICH